MRIRIPTPTAPVRLATLVALALASLTTAQAATTGLAPKIGTRAVTSSDLRDYSLPSTLQLSGGLTTIGVGESAYLEALINAAFPAGDVVEVTWTLTAKPVGSLATLGVSPLGTNVPSFSPADRRDYQIASRTFLRPDLTGPYTVQATIVTASNGTTNVTKTITAARYTGVGTCAFCHSGGVGAPDKYTPWTNTPHASMFAEGINGVKSDHYGRNCISCHTVGYDANTNAVNGGFDDMATQLGWTFPAVLTNGNWEAMPSALKNLANIQCENCHGAGSEHVFSDGTLGNTNRISVTFAAADCGRCHDAKDHHKNNAEWAASRHAIADTHPSGPGREGCIGCHTAKGFAGKMTGKTGIDPTYEEITCAACHDPHDASNPHHIRNAGPITLMDTRTTITNAGNGALCMNCHMSRRNATNYVEVTNGGSTFGPHEGPQADMLVGANAITYGRTIPSSAHSAVVEESCVHCHMQTVPSTDPAFLHAGGHTFNVSAMVGTNKVELAAACRECHGPINTFNFPRQDYDGDGVIDGIQTEVQHLLNKLAYLLPPVGVAKPDITINTNWTRQQLRAGYNYRFVQKDGSLGVHNLSYAVGLLKASIADLNGDANNDGLADWWQIKYYGSINNPNGAPNATPLGDNIPNWLKFALGLDPTIAGITVPGGVVWAQGNSLINPPGETNTIHIYTAAEVVFDTEVGKTYQLESISSLDGGWHSIGDPIPGTGTAMSYLTPTRANVQQFYRVMTRTP